jgi:sortase A
MNVKRKHGKKVIILTAVALAAAVCAYWLLSAPNRERDSIANAQEAMIEDLMRDIAEAEETPEETEDITDLTEAEDESETAETQGIEYITDGVFSEDDADGFENEETDIEPEPAYIPVFEPVFSDPIPDNDFPNAVTGIGILTIESINLRLPIAEGIEADSLRIAPGRVPQTAQVGDIGNAVIAGHRNYTFGSMFNRLGEIDYGDVFQYQARNGEMMEFSVFEIAVIEPEDQIAFIQPLNDSIITLYTCTPVREATHRLIIRAQRVS